MLLLISACEGSGGVADAGTSGSGGGTPSTTGFDEFIRLSCERARTCCAREGFDTSVLADCEAQSGGDLAASIRSGKTILIEPAYGECLALWRATGSVCELGNGSSEGCDPFFRGTVPTGGACEEAAECAKDSEPVVCLRTDSIPDEEPGVCRELTRAGEGQACLTTANIRSYGATFSTFQSEAEITLAYCAEEDGLHCSFADGVCVPFIADGAACTDGDQCNTTAYCDETTLLCTPKKSAGSACTASAECALPALFCKEGACTVPTFGDTEVCEGDLD